MRRFLSTRSLLAAPTMGALAIIALAAACGSSSSRTRTNTSTQVRTATNASASLAAPATVSRACPVPQSGTCLGKLAAGNYTTRTFRPGLTFRVPTGWANYLDVSGLYLLQPPGAQPPGNSIVGSFVGLETSVAPEAFDCQSPVNRVRTTPSAIAAWMKKQPDLVISHRHGIALGGLHGVVLDVRMARGTKGCLSVGATVPAAPLLVGIGPSSFDHEVPPGNVERHYLLNYHGGTLDIGVIDTSRGQQLASYDAIVRTFRFAP
jgi:hypothetical protein